MFGKKREEAERQAAISGAIEREAEAKAVLQNKNVQYYSLNGVAINYHDTGLYDDYFEGFVQMPEQVTKARQREIEAELNNAIQERKLGFSQLVSEVLGQEDEDYWAYLFWNAAPLIRMTSPYNGTDDKIQLSRREERNAVKDIYSMAFDLSVLFARDLVRLVMNECPDQYLLVLFDNSKEIADRIHARNKFKDAKKDCL